MKNNPHKKNIPNGWGFKKMSDVLDYERPDKYIVKSTSYSDKAKTPVLTANKSFILGYTDEDFGIYKNTPAIIFDDFTTDSKFIDFPFKIKSSAIKILKAKNKDADLRFVYEKMKSINFPTGSHKRFYISQYQNMKVLMPPFPEQQKIAGILGAMDESIAKTQEVIESTEKLKRGLMQSVLSFKNKEDVKYLAFGDIGKVSMCKRIFKKETSETGDIPFYKIGTFGKEPDSFIPQEIFDNYRNKFPFPKTGDILLSASGTIGRKVKYDGRPAYFQDSNIIWLKHDESMILNNFLFHLYDTIKWQTEGSTIKRLYNDIFLKKIIPVPSISRQKQVVEILSAVDEKISVNKKLKAKLTTLKKGLMQDLLSGKVRVKIWK
ncbi:MAG: restriction endonuclease subunit S [Patescibacteria group bacterium]